MSIKLQNVHDYFNETDNYLRGNSTVFLRKYIVSELINKPVGENIIDIGCGNGYVSIPHLDNNTVTFLDLSKNMLEELKKNISPDVIKNAKFVNTSIEGFNSDKKYHIVILLGVLAHVEDIEKCIEKISNLTSTDAICIVQITDSEKCISKAIKGYTALKRIMKRKSHYYKTNKLNRSSTLEMFAKYGFSLLEEKPYFPPLPGFRFLKQDTRTKFLMKSYKSKLASKIGSELIFKFVKNPK